MVQTIFQTGKAQFLSGKASFLLGKGSFLSGKALFRTGKASFRLVKGSLRRYKQNFTGATKLALSWVKVNFDAPDFYHYEKVTEQ